ncbi:MAG: hypothetical protein ACXIT4_05050 [Erythrobacter sp.]
MEIATEKQQEFELGLAERAQLLPSDESEAQHALHHQASPILDGQDRLEAGKEDIFNDEADDAEEGDNTFSDAPMHSGEILIPIKSLGEWAYHPTIAAKGQISIVSRIAQTAKDPSALEPVLVLKTADGYVIIDGRKRWLAVQLAHPGNCDVAMRCIAFEGTDAEALQLIAGRALGSAPLTDIQLGRLLLNLVRVAGISQKAICERFPMLKKDQVSLKIKAAKTFEQYPSIFALLEEPERVAINICVRLGQFMNAASEDERKAVCENAQQLRLAGKPIKAPRLLVLLGVEEASNDESNVKPNPFAPVSQETVFGHDDQPVGAVEMLADNITRVRLPDPAVMSLDERQAAAASFVAHILVYFGLEKASN